jgi:hypothetical protein
MKPLTLALIIASHNIPHLFGIAAVEVYPTLNLH